MDDEQFRAQYLCQYVSDPKFDWYLDRWAQYYELTDQADRALGRPNSKAAHRIRRRLFVEDPPPFPHDPETSKRAQEEALRRHDK